MAESCEYCGDDIEDDNRLARAYTYRDNGDEVVAGPVYTYCIICAPDAIVELERDDSVDKLIIGYDATDLHAVVGR